MVGRDPLSILFAFVMSVVVLPFLMFLFYFWLKIREKQGKEIRTEPPTEHVPLRQLLGPLPPIPEPLPCFYRFPMFAKSAVNIFLSFLC